ncbi:testis development-related protein isoform X2 [Heptranchias perlo]|uniref:testis development-related protein isoform X2 n=1 Tax=Heptranchias perlo TaxID=212740 RepID=UPI00355AAEBD
MFCYIRYPCAGSPVHRIRYVQLKGARTHCSQKRLQVLSHSSLQRTTVKLKDEVKMEKKSSFWDSLGIKQNSASKIPTEDEGWDPQVMMENPCSNLTDSNAWPDWTSETSGSSKYTSLDSEANTSGSRWSIMSAGKLPGIRRRSKGNLTECWEDLE